MRYALIENGVVSNIIWLYEGNAEEFPSAVLLNDRPVCIGDGYASGKFIHDEAVVTTLLEDAQEAIAELDAALLDAEYQRIVGGEEV